MSKIEEIRLSMTRHPYTLSTDLVNLNLLLAYVEAAEACFDVNFTKSNTDAELVLALVEARRALGLD